MAQILFIPHARKRMKERGISEEEVKAVLDDPDHILPERRGRRDVLKRVAGRLIRVVYKESSGTRVVITAYCPEESTS